MGSTAPKDKVTLVSSSLTEDLSFLALADLVDVFASAKGHARLIGGLMVSIHAQRWNLGQELYRETHDADLGVTRMLVNESSPVETLLKKGYAKISSNRLGRTIDEIKAEENQALIDILVPALRTRARSAVRVGNLETSEVPGLSDAFLRDPLMVELTMHRLNGDQLHATVALPDEASALVLKTLAWKQRQAPRDAIDMWRCLEIAFAAGLRRDSFTSSDADSANAVLRRVFEKLTSPAMSALTREQKLATNAAAARHTRIRALMKNLLEQ